MTNLATNERRDRTRHDLTHLVRDRNEMLSQYCMLAGIDAKRSRADEQEMIMESELLQEFCENLIDYLARGQFELYQRISDKEERRHDIVVLANEIYPQISDTTNLAVEFNDAYDRSIQETGEFKDYGQKLSNLGEGLATRFELEDKLINSILAPKEVLTETACA